MLLYGIVIVFLAGFFIGMKTAQSSESSTQEKKRVFNLLQNEIARTTNKKLKTVLTKVQYRVYGYAEDEAQKQAENHIRSLGASQKVNTNVATSDVTEHTTTENSSEQATSVPTQSTSYSVSPSTTTQFDKTALLLYFGAFLFITSVGLFVAFGGLSGAFRTMLVGLVALIVYMVGAYLYRRVASLAQVGEAFVGMGMILLPLTGVAAYVYIFEQGNGTAIWAITSIVALLLYTYTVFRLRTTFVSYMLIGSVVSSMLSLVGIINGPLYGFVWMLLAVGLVMQLMSIVFKNIPTLRDASYTSSTVLAPLAIFLSVLALLATGTGQLAVTFGLSSAYYLLGVFTDPAEGENHATTSHFLAVLAVALGVYSLYGSFIAVGYALIALSLIHTGIVVAFKNILSENMRMTATATAAFATVFAIQEPLVLHIALTVLLLFSVTLSWKCRASYGVAIATVAWLLKSLSIGQYLLQQNLDTLSQLIFSSIHILVLFGVFIALHKKSLQAFADIVKSSALIGLMFVAIAAFFVSPYALLGLFAAWSVVFFAMKKIEDDQLWSYLGYIAIYTPFVYAIFTHLTHESSSYFFSITSVIALGVSIGSSLIYRSSWSRWMSVFVWIVLPYALAHDKVFSLEFSSTYIMWSYLLVAVICVFSRLIALGKIFGNAKLPIQSMMLSHSFAYSTGFFTALAIVSINTLVSSESAVVQSSVLLAVGSLLTVYGVWVEKNKKFYAVIPITVQLWLTRLLIPVQGGDSVLASLEIDYTYALPLVSSLLGTCLVIGDSLFKKQNRAYRIASIFSIFYPATFAIFLGTTTWPMPFALLVASASLFYLYPHVAQASKEWIGLLVTTAVAWILYYHGITHILVYTHIAATLTALYAVLRNHLKQHDQENNYIYAGLLLLTIPLALAALQDSHTYGLLLLFEQIGIFLVGISLSRPFIVKWGLYASVATVVFQLRGLGWAMLTVISVFIIGLAVYNALKTNKKD